MPDTSRARVLVVGDVMLDRYWFGEVSRISPEAPVPVVKVERSEERPGGAANVARNAKALGAQGCAALGGRNRRGRARARSVCWSHSGIDTSLLEDPGLDTTVKLRVIGRQQQLLRVDFETWPNHEVLQSKLAEFETRVTDTDVVILSDYGKGGLTHITEMIRLARAAGKPVLVDPKGDDYARYSGATLLTPNRAELREVVGKWRDDTDLAQRAERLRGELHIDALLVTRSEEGMTLFRDDGATHEPAAAREVFDVSGAGDTVIATLAVMLASGVEMVHAMRIANHAAGIVVGKLGTAVVELDELGT